MATVKMSGGKVVTKAGKVSCTCCAAVCCMYSAQGFFDGGFLSTDLPDQVTIVNALSVINPPFDYLLFNGTLTQTGSGYSGTISWEYWVTDFGLDPPSPVLVESGTCAFTYEQGEIFGIKYWIYHATFTFSGGSFDDDFGSNLCLVFPTDASGQRVEDDFSDAYTVNGVDAIIRDPLTNLCLWSGYGWTLRYNSTAYQFELNGTAKTGDQNTPAGTYGENTVT